MEDFTVAERARLAPHFSNVDGPVFALLDLPETVKGAMFARYSRYQGTLRRMFLDEFADSLPQRTAAADGDIEGAREDPKEVQADEWAEEALIPRAIWETSAVRQQPTAMSVINLANALQVHPAIVAGKIRHEQRNFRLLSQFVGTGEVRRHFGLAA